MKGFSAQNIGKTEGISAQSIGKTCVGLCFRCFSVFLLKTEGFFWPYVRKVLLLLEFSSTAYAKRSTFY